jgi:endoglycosylceramidase
VRPAATVNPPTLRHRWLVALVCGWMLAVLAAAAGASADPWSGIGRVRAPGGPFLRDAHGRRLQLHGVDLVGKCGGGARPAPAAGTPCVGSPIGSQPAFVLSPTASDPGRRFTAADAATLAQLGFTVVRLGIVWQGLEPGPTGAGPNDPRYCALHRAGTRFPSLGAGDPYRASAISAYLASTDRIMALLAHAGLRVILDMHQDVYGSAFSERRGPSPWNGEGAPPWATCTDGRAFAGRPYWGLAYTASSVQTAIRHFWHNDVRADLQGQFARVWQAVARHYRGDPDVLGYEVFNEPTDFSTPDFSRDLQCAYAGPRHAPRSCATSGVQALRTGLIGAIEAADPTRLVLVEPVVTAGLAPSRALGVAEPLRFGRLVLAVHLYGTPPAGVFGCPGTVCQGSERQMLARLVAERTRMRTLQPGGPAMILDEFGGGPSIPDISQVADMANRASLSWTYWSALQLHDPTGAPGENLLNDRTAQAWPAKAQVLAGPYPLATAGTPGPVAFDSASRSFGFIYTVDRRVRAPTEIVVPPYTYPQGYVVVVQGAAVTSAPDAPLLTLRPLPGSRRVAVLLAASG